MEISRFGMMIKNINDKIKTNADNDLKKYNLTLAQNKVLVFLNEHGAEATQKQIEIWLEVSHPTVVGIISRMEAKDLVKTQTDSMDKRNKIVRLTGLGKSFVSEMKNHAFQIEETLVSGMTEQEKAELTRLLTQILKNLSE